LSSAQEAVKTGNESGKLKSPLSEAAARERLFKNSRLEEGLAGAVVTCEL
jgi:hypothetical protein